VKRKFFIHNFIKSTLPMLLVAALLGGMIIYLTIHTTEKDITTINEQTLERIGEGTELMFNNVDIPIFNYHVSPYIMLRLEDVLKSGYAAGEYRDISYMIQTILDSSVNSNPFLYSIYIFLENERGNLFASSVGLVNSGRLYDNLWIEQVRSMPPGRDQWLENRLLDTGFMYSMPVITSYKRIYSPGQLDPIGVLVTNIRQDYFLLFCRSYLSYPNQSVILLGGGGTVLCGAGPYEAGPYGVADVLPDIKSLGKTHFVSYKESETNGLTYISMVPRNILGAQAAEMIRLVIIAIIIILLLGGIFAYLLTLRNVREVEGIVRLLDQAEKGETLWPSGNVYGYITRTIIKTFLEKDQLRRQVFEKKYLLESMEFSLLQSQLNPHFLFNTLKNIFWKTVSLTGKTNSASRMIDLLSGVLRYALVNKNRYVTVAEEIDNIRKYIEIQQNRYDNGFQLTWSCQGDIENARCIKFILQPLVENSIEHGIREKPGSVISISVRVEPGEVFFSVADNGAGFTPERLEEITRSFEGDASPAEGIGLYNLNKRLVLAYGPASALAINSEPDRRTLIAFSIPRLED
jgi:two-component system sensor histidine kinase YesM